MKNVVAVAIFWINWLLFAYSQGGSLYSIYGFGDPLYTHSAASDAMGTTEIAIPIGNRIATVNPALWSSIDNIRVESGYLFRQFIILSDRKSVAHNNGRLQGVRVAIPSITPSRFTISFGIQPTTLVNYYIETTEQVSEDDIATISYLGLGGLSEAYFGSSFRVPDLNITLGGGITYTFGKISRTVQTTFPSTQYQSSFRITTDWFSSIGGMFGLFYTGISPLLIGAAVHLPSQASVTRTIQYGTGRLPDTTVNDAFTTPLPYLIGIGASYHKGNWTIGADFKLLNASAARYNAVPATAEYSTGSILSFGTRWQQSKYPPRLTDIRSWTFFGGIHWEKNPVKIRNNTVNKIAGSTGVEIPVNPRTVLTTAITVGHRSSAGATLVQDWFFNLSFTLSVGELWFR